MSNERTWLAWQRTALSLLVATLLTARLIAFTNVVPALLLALIATVTVIIFGAVGRRQYVRDQDRLRRGRSVSPGIAATLITGLFLLLGTSAFTWVIITS